MRKVILYLFLILFCTSCLEIPTEGNEVSIGHIDRLIYTFVDKASPSSGCITRVIARYGEVTVCGNVNLNRFASNWWAYVDYNAGTVRFVDNRNRRKITPVYQIYKEIK